MNFGNDRRQPRVGAHRPVRRPPEGHALDGFVEQRMQACAAHPAIVKCSRAANSRKFPRVRKRSSAISAYIRRSR